jgi:DNA-binding transcriptional ArsR family regulator
MTQLIRSFAALSDATRLSILDQLMRSGECPAGDLVAESDISAPAISRHLKVLREAGLVTQRAEGTKRLYSANPEGLKCVADWAIARQSFWSGSLDRLEAAILNEAELNG